MTSEQVFVARENQLARLNNFLGRALAGQGTVCFVEMSEYLQLRRSL